MRILSATYRTKKSRRGLSLAEVMISLAISAMLLTAVAAAFTASSDAIEQNDTFFRASQAARVSMTQILSEVRRATTVNKPPTSTAICLSMKGHDGKARDYIYVAASKKLQLVTADPSAPNYTLASNCTDTTFGYELDPTNSFVTRVTVTITVKVDKNTIRLTGAAAIRSQQSWQ